MSQGKVTIFNWSITGMRAGEREPYGPQQYISYSDHLRMVAEPLAALQAMIKEFRGYDLPYGSKAYQQAITARNNAGGGEDS